MQPDEGGVGAKPGWLVHAIGWVLATIGMAFVGLGELVLGPRMQVDGAWLYVMVGVVMVLSLFAGRYSMRVQHAQALIDGNVQTTLVAHPLPRSMTDALGAFVLGLSAAMVGGGFLSQALDSGHDHAFSIFLTTVFLTVYAGAFYLLSPQRTLYLCSRLLALVGVCLSMLMAVIIIWDLPRTLFGAALVALGPCLIQALPDLIVHVPERYLLQWRRYMSERWTVRSQIPEASRTLTRDDVAKDIGDFHVDYALGLVLACILIVFGLVDLGLVFTSGNSMDQAGLLALGPCVILYLVVRPRQSGRPYERHILRITGIVTACVYCWMLWTCAPIRSLISSWYVLLVLLLGLVGLIMVSALFPQHTGFHSLVLSRIGDAIVMAALILTPLAAFFAAGAFELLRSGV